MPLDTWKSTTASAPDGISSTSADAYGGVGCTMYAARSPPAGACERLELQAVARARERRRDPNGHPSSRRRLECEESTASSVCASCPFAYARTSAPLGSRFIASVNRLLSARCDVAFATVSSAALVFAIAVQPPITRVCAPCFFASAASFALSCGCVKPTTCLAREHGNVELAAERRRECS